MSGLEYWGIQTSVADKAFIAFCTAIAAWASEEARASDIWEALLICSSHRGSMRLISSSGRCFAALFYLYDFSKMQMRFVVFKNMSSEIFILYVTPTGSY
jgi:hypothetical protein